jgi:hypothetical protein
MIDHFQESNIRQLQSICLTSGGRFTLGDVVTRVLEERPGMIQEFADAWSEMLQRDLVRVCRPGRPAVYEVVALGSEA